MEISGTGIGTFTAKVLPGFRPLTSLALQWRELADGNWIATDRGAAADTYDSRIQLYGTETVINEFIKEMYDNRAAASNVFAMGSFADDELIFGADVDHTGSISGTVLEIGDRAQRTWKGFAVQATIRALSPSFVGSATLPSLTSLEHGFEGDSTRPINKSDTYDGTMSYADRRSDAGFFTGTFLFTLAEMRNLRRYLTTQRGATISIASISGVTYPFGTVRASGYPYSVKVLQWEDLGVRGVGRWRMRLKLAEVIS